MKKAFLILLATQLLPGIASASCRGCVLPIPHSCAHRLRELPHYLRASIGLPLSASTSCPHPHSRPNIAPVFSLAAGTRLNTQFCRDTWGEIEALYYAPTSDAAIMSVPNTRMRYKAFSFFANVRYEPCVLINDKWRISFKGGLGLALNRTSNIVLSSNGAVLYNGASTSSLSGQVGIGLDYQVRERVRLGISLKHVWFGRFVNTTNSPNPTQISTRLRGYVLDFGIHYQFCNKRQS